MSNQPKTQGNNEEMKPPPIIGRDNEKQAFQQLLDAILLDNQGSIWLFLGSGGIGKTYLLKDLLERAEEMGETFLVLDLIDMYDTKHRYITGTIDNIIEQISKQDPKYLTGKAEKEKLREILVKLFPLYSAPHGDNRTNFRKDLQALTQDKVLVLAFDTMENVIHPVQDVEGTIEYLTDPVVNWILDAEFGLFNRGIILLLGSRLPITGATNLVQKSLLGFSLEEALQFYLRFTKEIQTTEGASVKLREQVAALREKTNGHPLLLEMIFTWASAGLWDVEELQAFSKEEFEARLMQLVQELAEAGRLHTNVHDPYERMSPATYNTMVCMAYMRRRFNLEMLNDLIAENIVVLEEGETVEQIIRSLQTYFFVKDRGNRTLQLHDELTRLVRQYIWQSWQNADRVRSNLKEWIIQKYVRLIQEAKTRGDLALANTCRAEQLYYILEFNLRQGRNRFIDLVQFNDPELNRLITGEMRPYINRFAAEEQIEVLSRLARLEAQLGHNFQAAHYWNQVLIQAQHRDDQTLQIDAWIGLHEVHSQRTPQQSLTDYLLPALKLAQEHVPEKLARVEYETALTERQLQNIEAALDRYEQARLNNASDPILMGSILNDMGFAYAWAGDYERGMLRVTEAIHIRNRIYQRRLEELRELEQSRKDRAGQELEYQRDLKQIEVNTAELRLGMSYNTRGTIARYQDRLGEAIQYSDKALEIFRKYENPYWLVTCLTARGEALRRLADQLYERNLDKLTSPEFVQAHAELAEALNLADKYAQTSLFDTVYRHQGRLDHDDANVLLATGRREEASVKLATTQIAFELALRYARETKDELEQFECLVELAFLTDDLIACREALSQAEYQTLYNTYIQPLDEAIQAYQPATNPIYQFPVFQHLLEIEQGAYYYVTRDFERALAYYLSGYAGMACQPGYGSARYLSHLGHLQRRIEAMGDDEQAEAWCEAFIAKWVSTTCANGTLLATLHPNMVDWCSLHKINRSLKF